MVSRMGFREKYFPETFRKGERCNEKQQVVFGGWSGGAGAVNGGDCGSNPPDVAGTGDFPAGALRVERAAVPVLQVPVDGGKRRGDEEGPGTSECAGDRVQDSGRPAIDRDRVVSAKVFDRRVAAVVERAARGYVAGGAASGGAERGGAVSTVAAAAAADASGADVPVGDLGPGQRGFRDLDEDGHAVHRQLVAGARLEDSVADYSPRAGRPRGELRPLAGRRP